MKPILSYITPRNIACFILVLFCIQYIPIESRDGVSFLKLAVSALCPFIIVIYSPKVGRTTVLFMLYYALIIVTAMVHPDTLRWSTVIFMATFIVVFITYYNLVVCENVFSKDFFTNLLKRLILAYTVVLIIQQFFITKCFFRENQSSFLSTVYCAIYCTIRAYHCNFYRFLYSLRIFIVLSIFSHKDKLAFKISLFFITSNCFFSISA